MAAVMFWRFIPPGARVVAHMRWYHRLYNSVPLRVRKVFWE